MRHTTLIAGTILATLSGSSIADMLTFESTGIITDFSPGFDGADEYPFVGLDTGDSLFYHFEFESTATPISMSANNALFELDGAGSYAVLGSTVVNFERIRISVGSSDGVIGGYFNIEGYVDSLGINAGIGMQGGAFLAPELPSSIDVSQFNWARNSGANSDQNQVLFPIVLGTVDTATITPAPASSALLLAAAGFARRRRRA